MPEFGYQDIEAWNTAVRLTAAVGRLKIGSNLKAAADAQAHAFEQAGLVCALIAEASSREGGAAIALYRDARGSIAQCRSWIHVLAAVTNEKDALFANEFDLAETAARQVSGILRTIDRGPAPGPRPLRPGPQGPQGPRPVPQPGGRR